ncbi:MAG: TIGR01777 family oxidoreductase [Chloroflexi bacterium]|nr:TIGR01777 family oxidoreductase [Chloroflexota bacterium]
MTRVVVAGGSGLIGRALVASLIADGVEVDVLSRDPRRRAKRTPAGARATRWDPADPPDIDPLAQALAGADAVVNVTGAPVGPGPWTPGRKRAIVASRVGTTAALVAAVERLPPGDRPGVLVNASGTDVYTGLDATPATESDEVGSTPGFLARLGRDWEAAAFRAEDLGVRVVAVRTSFVLAANSPLLRLFALPTRLFVGGPIGGGRQWFSWIHIDDLVRVYRLAIEDEALSGVVNAAAPGAVRQADLARAMGRVLRRPSIFPVPAWPLRLVLREQATLVLGSRRVAPARLQALGFRFAYPEIDAALGQALGPTRAAAR